MLSQREIAREAKRIVKLVTTPPYLLPSLMISDGAPDQKNFSQKDLLSDLGDYLPFLFIFGAKEFCEKHIKQISQISLPTKSGILYSYDYTDYLHGLFWYWNKTGSLIAKKLINSARVDLSQKFKLGRRTCSLYSPFLRLSIPVLDTRDGMFLELFTDQLFDLYEQLVSVPLFRKVGLWPSFFPHSWARGLKIIPRYRENFNKITFIKNNANTLQGMLALYRKTGDKDILKNIDWAFEACRNYLLLESGFIIHEGVFDRGKIRDRAIHSASNHTAIDLFCDLAFYLKKKKYLAAAKKIANAWLKIQGDTGLFPKSPKMQIDNLDSQTDMIVALVKLAEITGEEKYKTAAKKCLEGVYLYHREQNGYVLEVNTNTGTVTNKNYKTKFIVLFLKALYLFLAKDKIYQNPQLHEILKDR